MLRSKWMTWLLGALLVLGTAACSDAPPKATSPQAEKFRQEVLGLLQQKVAQVKPLIEKGHASVQQWMDNLFNKAKTQGAPLQHELVLLSHKMTVVAWQGPKVPGSPQTYKAVVGQNYSHFKELDPVYEQHRIANFKIYSRDGDGFGLCAPVLKNDKFLACFCLGFDPKVLRDKYGIDGKQFLALNFN
jgi:hypothetical protein